jgi:hypothetical protein
MTRDPLRFTAPHPAACDCPSCQRIRDGLPIETPVAPRTPEDGQRVTTPEQGQRPHTRAGDIDYAKVGGPPRDWHKIIVLDAATDQELDRVIEANATEGWVVRRVREGNRVSEQRTDMPIRIMRPPMTGGRA